MTFDEAIREAESVEIMAEIMGCVSDEGEARELFEIHSDEDDRLGADWSEVGEELRPLDWFLVRGLPLSRYVAYLARVRLRCAIESKLFALATLDRLDDPPEDFDRQVGEMTRAIFKMRMAHPGEP